MLPPSGDAPVSTRWVQLTRARRWNRNWTCSRIPGWLTSRSSVPAIPLLVFSLDLACLADRLQVGGVVQIEALLEERFEQLDEPIERT